MAPAATLHHLEIALSDSDRGVYESLDLRIARMRELHAGSADPLALRLIKHSLAERAEVVAKLG